MIIWHDKNMLPSFKEILEIISTSRFGTNNFLIVVLAYRKPYQLRQEKSHSINCQQKIEAWSDIEWESQWAEEIREKWSGGCEMLSHIVTDRFLLSDKVFSPLMRIGKENSSSFYSRINFKLHNLQKWVSENFTMESNEEVKEKRSLESRKFFFLIIRIIFNFTCESFTLKSSQIQHENFHVKILYKLN